MNLTEKGRRGFLSKSSGSDRRLKRLIYAPQWEWFAVVQPRLTPILRAEMEELGFSIIGEEFGGVVFRGRIEEGYRANLHLRSASRIYLRLASFRAGAVEELFRRCIDIPWEFFIPPGTPVSVKTVLEHARISRKDRAAETVNKAVLRRLKREAAEEEEPTRLLLRIIDNRAVLSLDTSGVLLHKRGYRIFPGAAPLREDIAAATLLGSLQISSGSYDCIVDPFCGSGTLAIEAFLLAANIPPGINREFAFEKEPCLKARTWQHLKKKGFENRNGILPRFFLSDSDGGIVSGAQRNAQRAGLDDRKRVQFAERDFFTLDGKNIVRLLELPAGSSGLLVMHPPFGLRLPLPDSFYKRLAHHLGKSFAGWDAVVVLPESVSLPQSELMLRFRHGGINATASFLKL